MDEETVAQEGKMTCPMSYTQPSIFLLVGKKYNMGFNMRILQEKVEGFHNTYL